jgi:diguanylate cyclase (GGDEF)-like protein
MSVARDPRLAEIAFLDAVERSNQGEALINVPEADRHGLGEVAFADMVTDLLFGGFLTGSRDRLNTNPASSVGLRAHLEEQSEMQYFYLLHRKMIHVRLTHRGRVRLWELRDALMTGRDRDPFGILLDQRYWKRDLEVRMLDVTPETPVVAVLLDVDNFKAVNDREGHDAGDAVLKTVFSLSLDLLGERGDVYRRGGDEVFALMPQTTLDEARSLCEELRVRVERSFIESPAPAPTVSIGVVEFRQRANAEAAAKAVDAIQYQAKRGGKNRVELGAHP